MCACLLADAAHAVECTSAVISRDWAFTLGSILPMGPVLQSTTKATSEVMDWVIVPGRDGAFDLYEDRRPKAAAWTAPARKAGLA